ncbi:platelet-activating factor acetylhydrolase isoform X1 [Eurytemora carolleeae]|uniref:platelet-activating factor acetylhydrolase isoform X1 n=1 Tax=Eurytemora carolleeae TaxID=1294199 RepID=UPI000C77DA4D|nr:platelet-activating factor acetylhydrolase isoform X1 [Eurytemora carolleeae]|eukprot:XP_023333646.1 platelet-activating factor acetylhydrolase-like isoform X1 [Eurytemora affinis]
MYFCTILQNVLKRSEKELQKMPLFNRSQEPVLPGHLPLPTGPYAVGYQDIMTPGDPTSGVYVRVYYPSIHPVNETINMSELWPVWADDDYLVGFVKFMQIMLEKWPSWAPRGEFMYFDQMKVIAPMMHIGCKQVFKLLNGTVHCPILKGVQISTEKKWPLIVFSHGLGCNRFAYSRICTDLASHGLIVAATEHRDGSSSLSSYYTEDKKKTWIPHRKLSDQDKEYAARNQQLQQRCSEMQRTLDLMINLSSDTTEVLNILEDSDDLIMFDIVDTTEVLNILEDSDDLSMFEDQIDHSEPVAAGHSFGGATTLLTLHKESR